MARRSVAPLLLTVAVVLAVVGVARGIKFDVSPNQERCLTEELSRDVLVLGNYSVEQQQPSLRLHFRVRLIFDVTQLFYFIFPQTKLDLDLI